MSLNEKDVKKIANLARISVNEQEISAYQSDLNRILGFVEQMNQADQALEGIKPMSHPTDVTQRLREDTVTEPDQRDLFQENAPETAHGLYLVEQVIE